MSKHLLCIKSMEAKSGVRIEALQCVCYFLQELLDSNHMQLSCHASLWYVNESIMALAWLIFFFSFLTITWISFLFTDYGLRYTSHPICREISLATQRDASLNHAAKVRWCESKADKLTIWAALLYENTVSVHHFMSRYWMGKACPWHCWHRGVFSGILCRRRGNPEVHFLKQYGVWQSYCCINFTKKYLFHFAVLVSKYSLAATAIASLAFCVPLTRSSSAVLSLGLCLGAAERNFSVPETHRVLHQGP